MAGKLSTRVGKEFGVARSAADILMAPTIYDMAKLMNEREQERETGLVLRKPYRKLGCFQVVL